MLLTLWCVVVRAAHCRSNFFLHFFVFSFSLASTVGVQHIFCIFLLPFPLRMLLFILSFCALQIIFITIQMSDVSPSSGDDVAGNAAKDSVATVGIQYFFLYFSSVFFSPNAVVSSVLLCFANYFHNNADV